MKKNSSLVPRHSSLVIPLMALAITLLMPARVMAEEDEVNGLWYDFNSATAEATVVKSQTIAYTGDIVIPQKVKYQGVDYTVTSIAERAFYGRSINSVAIPATVATIGNEAFYYCPNMTSVTFDNGVKTIGERAFFICYALTALNIPQSVQTIGANAFNGCSALNAINVDNRNPVYDSRDGCNAIIETATNTLITGCRNTAIPATVTAIGDNAFYKCVALISIAMPASVTAIGNYAFASCDKLTTMHIPASVTTIGNYAFESCKNLRYINLPNSVTSVGLYALKGCWELTSIEIPNSMTAIPHGMFYECSALTDVTIPTSVSAIGNYAFYTCSSLTTIAVPNSVTSIGNNTFANCEELTSVTLGREIRTIGTQAFLKCPKLSEFYCEATRIPSTQSNAFNNTDISIATLHVPAAALNTYSSTAPWSGFGTILPLPERCAKPVITVVDGKLRFTCATEGVTFRPTVIYQNVQTNGDEPTNDEMRLTGNVICRVSVYATKEGYEDSDVATKDVQLNVGTKGDVNGDGAVSPADAIEALYIFFGVGASHAPQHLEPAIEPQ